jgi:HK97 family phage major capsid protein/HK97 family phage prohead protease
MNMVRKAATVSVDGLEFVLSDATVDRYGDIVEPGGWDLRAFKKNPIALFGHSSGFPIGKWADVRVDGGKLKGRLEFASEGTSDRIDELRRLVEQGILRAVSVGFRPIEAVPINDKEPWGAQRYTKQELLETSLVSVPANPAAISLARSLHISDDTLAVAFGEHAEAGNGMVRRGTTGEHAAPTTIPPRNPQMPTLSQRIVDAQDELVVSRDKLAELNAAENMDLDAIEELNTRLERDERALALMKASEAKLAGSTAPAAPAIARAPLGFKQREVGGMDLIVRAAVVNACSMFSGKSLDRVLDERYPGHEATAIVAKSDQTVGDSTTAGWAGELVQTSYAAFIEALRGVSIYPQMRDRGMAQSFDSAGTAYIPSLTAGGANGGFFAEGTPIRVGRITTAYTTMTAKKLGVIVPFTREAAKRSTPSLESVVRSAIIDDTAATLDAAIIDATAAGATRPAGLLNGVSATAVGYGGADYVAVLEDIAALMAPFDTANASNGLALIMHPAQARKLAMMPGPDGTFGWASEFLSEFTIIRSTHATANRLIAVRLTDFCTATGDAPQFEMSNTATIHMEDTTPLEIVDASETEAGPVRSFFQTDTMGIRMIMDVAWKMKRSGMVRWIDGTTW